MRFLAASVLLLAATAYAEPAERTHLDVAAGVHAIRSEGETHGGGGVAIRGHDLSHVVPIDVEVGFDRTTWDDDVGHERFHRGRATVSSWMEWDSRTSVTTLSLGGGLELRYLRRDIASTGGVVHAHATAPLLVASALHVRRVGPVWLGVEALVRGTAYGQGCPGTGTCGGFYQYGTAAELELRIVLRI
ncbi:MAG TPA: hypothetical protein VGM90_11570 [Kofleriaceae bacterium]|jgi:hypothetical protein